MVIALAGLIIGACGQNALPISLPKTRTPVPTTDPAPQIEASTETSAPPDISISATPTVEASQAPLPAETKAATPIGRLTSDLLRNMEYNLPHSQKIVRLSDGEYEGSNGNGSLSASISGIISFGDLDGDNREDAAFILSEIVASTDTFISLVVVTTPEGQPLQTYSILLGKQELINTITIQHARVILDMLTQGPKDQPCCPSLSVVRTFALTKGGLVLVNVTSKTSQDTDRLIKIDSPAAGSQVEGTVTVKGVVTISRFEKTLVYHLYDESNLKLSEGPIEVISARSGDPGTFEVRLDLPQVPAGAKIRLEVVDASAADGSFLALDSVELV